MKYGVDRRMPFGCIYPCYFLSRALEKLSEMLRIYKPNGPEMEKEYYM